MGRWTQQDEDEHRLPEGMQRVGYDSDSGRHLFRDREGALWKGPEGAQYGEMTRVEEAPIAVPEETHNEDLEAASSRADGYQPLVVDSHNKYIPGLHSNPYRSLFPFFLIIAVVLLLIYRLIVAPATSLAPACPATLQLYWVEPGDTCWEIARGRGMGVEELERMNPSLVCTPLMPGDTVCLPKPSPHLK